MLLVAGCISPPCVVGDDGHGACPFPYIISIILSINGLIAYSTSDRDVPCVHECDLILTDTSSHHSSQHVVDSAEYRRIWSMLHGDHKFAFVEDFGV